MFNPPPASLAPKWGIAAILGLVGVLGYTVHHRLSNEDRSWTRWEKHELTGVVLGQSPDRPATPAPTQRSSVPPLWSKSGTSRAESQKAPRQLGTSEAESVDPFAVGSVPAQSEKSPPEQKFEGESIAPRVLFNGEEMQVNAAPVRSAERDLTSPQQLAREAALQAELERSRPSQSEESAASVLDFTPSSKRRNAAAEREELNSSRFRRDHQIQQAAGVDQKLPDVGLPEPVPFQAVPGGPKPTGVPPQGLEIEPTPARLPEQSSPELRRDAVRELMPATLPDLDIHAEQRPAALPEERAGLPEQNFAEPLLSEPASPAGMNAPAQAPALEIREAPVPEQLITPTPQAQPQFQPQQMSAPIHNDPVPASNPLPQTTQLPTATPVATTAAAEEQPEEVYQVQSGDNYWTISRRYYGSARFFSALAEYNKHRIPSPEKMKPGMYVLVPHIEVLHQRYPQLTGGGPRDPAESAPPGFFVDKNGQPCYRVGKGDTLTEIAQKHLGRSSRWVQIQGMNKDRASEGQPLKIGTVLRLPGDASQVMLAPADSTIR